MYCHTHVCVCQTKKKAFLTSVRGVISPEVHMIPGDEGEFHYSYRTARAGIYFVSVLYDGVDIGGSPFKLTVDPVRKLECVCICVYVGEVWGGRVVLWTCMIVFKTWVLSRVLSIYVVKIKKNVL